MGMAPASIGVSVTKMQGGKKGKHKGRGGATMMDENIKNSNQELIKRLGFDDQSI